MKEQRQKEVDAEYKAAKAKVIRHAVRGFSVLGLLVIGQRACYFWVVSGHPYAGLLAMLVICGMSAIYSQFEERDAIARADCRDRQRTQNAANRCKL